MTDMARDLAERVAVRLSKGTRSGDRRQGGKVEERLMVWLGGRCLCDKVTGRVLWSVKELRQWHSDEGLGYLGEKDGSELWATMLGIGMKVDLRVWGVVGGWYYDMEKGELVTEVTEVDLEINEKSV